MNCLFQDNRSWLVFFSPPRCRFTYPHTGVTADVAQLPPTCCFPLLQLHTCSCRSGRFRSQGPPAGDKKEPPISPAASGRLLCWGTRHRRPCEALLCPHERIKECVRLSLLCVGRGLVRQDGIHFTARRWTSFVSLNPQICRSCSGMASLMEAKLAAAKQHGGIVEKERFTVNVFCNTYETYIDQDFSLHHILTMNQHFVREECKCS